MMTFGSLFISLYYLYDNIKTVVIAILLICFLLNIINHGNVLVGILNTSLLLFSILFYLKFSNQKLSSIKSLKFISPVVFLTAAIPLFIHNYNIFIVLLALGFCLLWLLYSISQKKTIIFIIFVYLLVAVFYTNGLIKLPLSLQLHQFIFSDDWIKLYILQMQREAFYVPYRVRLLIFNGSIYFYILLSKMVGLYMFKNLYDILLIANLYPLVKGFTLDLKDWNRSKTLIILSVLLISFITVISRTIDIFNTFILSAPFFTYYILKGFKSVSKITYLILFILSIVVATSPSK